MEAGCAHDTNTLVCAAAASQRARPSAVAQLPRLLSTKWEADEELGYRFSESAKEVALAIEDDMLLNGIKMAFMADYVEQLAGWAVGGEGSGRFVRDCLGYDNVEVMEEWDGLEALLEGGQGDPNRVRKGEELSQEL